LWFQVAIFAIDMFPLPVSILKTTTCEANKWPHIQIIGYSITMLLTAAAIIEFTEVKA
jgi:hypothetical protein